MKKTILILLLSICSSALFGQKKKNSNSLKPVIDKFLKEYKTSTNRKTAKVVSYKEDAKNKVLIIKTTNELGFSVFRNDDIQKLKSELKNNIPSKYSNYRIKIYAGDYEIEELVPNAYRNKNIDHKRKTENIEYKGANWVTNISKPYEITKGLFGRHLAVSQSHGKYYIYEEGRWKWQRPNLFATNEDMFTQSFVLQYIHPMLENAGAIIYTPRERDIQHNESIIDNDDATLNYRERNSRNSRWTDANVRGYSNEKQTYNEGENPFEYGSVRVIKAENKTDDSFAYAKYFADIKEDGEYSVYVSYHTFPNSVDDADYTVYHQGGKTEFKVNQRIGGGTWVYLGKFPFKKGDRANSRVIITNKSKNQGGYVSTDAIRFGGGMSCIVRYNTQSNLPKYLEGARYYAQWSGFPQEVYSEFDNVNDYSDDINARSKSINYISGGSVYNPSNKGLGVPLELSVSLHSDAGYSRVDDLIGTLGIYTTGFNDGVLSAGTSRLASRDLTDMIITSIKRDVTKSFKVDWPIRGMWDKNYNETRRPDIPSTIIELLSHQNFKDLTYGHDPKFKFVVGRAIYKAILRYIADKNAIDYVVQPLPINSFSAKFGNQENTVHLKWKPTIDSQEPTATSKKYVVYTAIDNLAFDNGVVVNSNSCTLKLLPNRMYSFKVTALNEGGESFPSEILSVYKSMTEKATVMIVNGFDKISAPTIIDTDTTAGFDVVNGTDISYMYNITTCGNQTNFDRSQGGKEGYGSLGYSEDDMVGSISAGNTFNYPYAHGQSIANLKRYSFVSTTKEAVENRIVDINKYRIVDYILGLQSQERGEVESNKTFTKKMQGILEEYCRLGGNLMVSGAFIGSDMIESDADRFFINRVLKYDLKSSKNAILEGFYGLKMNLSIATNRNKDIYRTPYIDTITPLGGAMPVLGLSNTKDAVGVAYSGNYKVFALSFPFEAITTTKEKDLLMGSILHFFTKSENRN